ncbi:MAG: hypothetical protein G01um101430_44 [Parcubacteria group bacterium Gr01-1014_30]|nr:MAG: hypothetical protein G01um101430_44 [Parcubacteria group bacterium Gr01-1014_30]
MAREWKNAILAGFVIFLFSAAWLYLRRWGAPLSEVYVKLSFSGVAVSGTALIAMAYLFGSMAHFWPETWEAKKGLRKYYGLFGFYLIVLHSTWGFLYLYPSFVDLPFILGILAFLVFSVVAFASLSFVAERMATSVWLFVQRLGYLALLLATVHFALLKWRGWLAFSSWPYFLPPLSLLLFIFVTFVFIMRILTWIQGSKKS